ncbi:hypothetical protein E1B28_003601 [Marasmius oreades]|uniref:F-box domain-containing protein n=1 Tax=Marasmius oreades TaxID=181124 RepID=A0A9P7UMP0_9AGAR|nr:uncharacterized protein E1B28_003601 [Marasmius oreades]KAG7086086.1 hypothetical protein E1B28_003601 [Marasmius oreades]
MEADHRQKVPTELWERIFAFVCFSPLRNRHQSLKITTHPSIKSRAVIMIAPMILSHVCSGWREIVIHYPRLWSFIKIQLWAGFPKGGTYLATTFLERSMPHPLDLEVSMMETMWRSEFATAALEVLKCHFARSERLVLDSGDWLDPFVLLPLQELDMTFNNLLSFHGGHGFPPLNDDCELETHKPLWRALRQASKLTSVQMQRFYLVDVFPWHQLTTLTIEFIAGEDIEKFLKILDVSKNLHTLILKYFEYATELPLDASPRQVEIPSLRTLSICSRVGSGEEFSPIEIPNSILDKLCASFVMPSLSNFEFSCESVDSESACVMSWPVPLLDMLQQSSATLRRVSLGIDFDRESINSAEWPPLSVLLSRTPHLTHFQFDAMGTFCDPQGGLKLSKKIIVPFLSDLRNTSDNVLLPELSHIALLNVGKLAPDIKKLALSVKACRKRSSLSKIGSSVSPLQEFRYSS